MHFLKAKAFVLEELMPKLPDDLTYHGAHHTLDVFETVAEYAKREGLGKNEVKLLRTAALYHDSGFVNVYKGHEEESCKIARETLPQFNYTNEEIERICGMIMATRLPQAPLNLLEEIMCDCDLDYLGRTDFYHIGSTLFQEFKVYGVVKTEEEWNLLQVKFLSTHKYFTETARTLRQPRKEKHLEEIKRIVEGYDSVSI